MAQMDYFRRPLLAGRNLPKTLSAVLRGSLRRSNPDGNSPVPYFPGVTPDSSLVVAIEGVEFTVTFTGNGFQTVISEINAELAGAATALDLNGCVGIQSLKTGGVGSVEVLGGSAATALGFDLKDGTPLRAAGGDLASSPEAGVGNPFGTAFPSRQENLSTDSFRIALGRLSANDDVLYSEIVRQQAKMAWVAEVPTSIQIAIPGTTRYSVLPLPPVETPIFNGLGLLTSASTKEELAPFYLLVDKKTKQPSASRVIGVVKGALPAPSFFNGELLPYGNAANADGVGNVLGQLLSRIGAQNASILDIRNGRVLKAAVGAFSKVKVGDWVKIDGADETINKDPTDNRGLRWIVEEKLGTDAIAVRPMSKSELIYAGTEVNDAQPVVELNDQKQPAQNFGTVTVYAGPFVDDVSFIISPPINDTVEFWGAVPMGYRSQRGYEDCVAGSPMLRTMMADTGDGHDSLIVPPVVTLTGTIDTAGRTANFSEMYVRWHGRVVRVGAQSIVIGGSKASSIYLYLDTKSLRVELTTSTATAAANLILGFVPAGSQSTFFDAARILDTKPHTITVGDGGQFLTLQAAMQWVAAQSTVEKYDVVVLNDTVLPTGGLKIPSSLIHIRGAGPTVTLSAGDGAAMLDLQGYTLRISNVSVSQANPYANIGLLIQQNVRYPSGGYSVYQNSSIGGLTFDPNGVITLDAYGANSSLTFGPSTKNLYLGKDDNAAYTTIKSHLIVNRTSELQGNLVVGKSDGTGTALFNGDVTIGVAGRAKSLAIIGTLSATGNVSFGATSANTVTSIAKMLAQGGLDVGTSSAWKDLTVYGAEVVKGNLTVDGSTTANGDIIGKGDLDLTQATGAKGVMKARSAQVAGTNGFNVDITGKVTVGGASKAYIETTGKLGNADAYLSATGQVVGKTAQVAGASGFNIDASGNTTVGPANRVYLGVDGLLKGRNLKIISSDGLSTLAEIATDGSATFGKKVTVDATGATGGAVNGGVYVSTSSVIVGSIDGTGAVSSTQVNVGGYKVLDLPQGNPSRGALNPIFLAVRQGRRLFADEEFQQGYNGISPYNNGTAGAVTHQRIVDTLAPNLTRYAIRINGSSNSGAAPNHGGFTFNQMSRVNAVFVQLFRAKVPTGTTLELHSNYYGDNSKSYFLTSNIGTGKWEDYVAVWVCGNNFSQAAGTIGFVSAKNTNATSVVWDLACATIFDVTDIGTANATFGDIDALGYVKAAGVGEFNGLKSTGQLDMTGSFITNAAGLKNAGIIDHYCLGNFTHRFFARNDAGADEQIVQFGRDRHWMGGKRLESVAEGTLYDAMQVRQFDKHFFPNDTGGASRNPVDWVDAPTNNGEGGTRAWPNTGDATNMAYPNIHRQDSGGMLGAYYWECPTLFYPQVGNLVWGLRQYTISPEAIFYWWHKDSGNPSRRYRLVLQKRYWDLDKSNPYTNYRGTFRQDYVNVNWTTQDLNGTAEGPWDVRVTDNGNFGWLEDAGHYYKPPTWAPWLTQDQVYQFRLKLEVFNDNYTVMSWDSANTQFLWRYAKINVR